MCRGDRGDVWSLGRALVSLEEEETRAQARTEEPVRMQGEDGRPHAEARGLRRAWPCPQPGHGPPALQLTRPEPAMRGSLGQPQTTSPGSALETHRPSGQLLSPSSLGEKRISTRNEPPSAPHSPGGSHSSRRH